MATVVLQYAGAALGTLIGGPVGGIAGRAAGAIAGNVIDQRLFGKTRNTEGPRLTDLRVMASEEGAAVPVMWGRMRLSGQVIWASNLIEVSNTSSAKASGKGGAKAAAKTTTYSYFANFAVGLCEGVIDGIGRVWADGREIDLSAYTTRLYTGGEAQLPDSLIEAVEGAGQAPAYRGLAYIVFERMPLTDFGNRIPQLAFEILRGGSTVAQTLRAVTIIPGATEFGYDTEIVQRQRGRGQVTAENAHLSAGRSDWTASLDQLQASAPNVGMASLVVAWFGNDLRCGSCLLRPGVDARDKTTTGGTWRVSGITRSEAYEVSRVNGAAAYGGTPSDASVRHAIADLKRRGLKVMFYPFVLMDVPANNQLPDPYGGASQAAYPWRGRMTASIAPGRVGTPDKTAAAAAEVNTFIGTATAAQFTAADDTVRFTGAAQWSYRRMILHYAKLCADAGGVDAFLIGSEMRGLTTLCSGPSTYPFVAALQALAAEVKAILPAAEISYAADWTEYNGHQPMDGSGDVLFHLDPLWASPAISFIGIDNYMPLSDWRDGTAHADWQTGWRSIHDTDYLKAGIAGGEAYDWYYATAEDRLAQRRTPISDGSYGKPWVFRPKDVKNWWLNPHYNRPGGVENATPTSWVPQSKPIWFTEFGCPAIDKGTNSPNVFVDVKSSESAVPHFSSGDADALMQGRYLTAMMDYWQAEGPHNPVSAVTGKRMVTPDRLFAWAWDARPYPAFPARRDVWGDCDNHTLGHWLNGRLGAVDMGELVQTVCARYGLDDVEVGEVAQLIDGFVIDRPMSGRDALQGLLQAFSLDAVESGGRLVLRSRMNIDEILAGELVAEGRDEAVLRETRAQETDLPAVVRISYADAAHDYRAATVMQLNGATRSAREIALDLPAAVTRSLAQARCDVALEEAWQQRTTAAFTLPPSQLALEPGDVVRLNTRAWRIVAIADGEARKVEAVAHEAGLYRVAAPPQPLAASAEIAVFGPPDAVLMDLAWVAGAQPASPWLAAQASPWPGQLTLLRQTAPGAYDLALALDGQATMGTTLTALSEGVTARINVGGTLDVMLDHGALSSISRAELLNGGNAAAVGTPETGFEIIQFERAELIAANGYRLRGLLRGLGGSAAEMLPMRAAGERFMLLNGAVPQVPVALAQAGLASTWRIGPAMFDHGHPAYADLACNGTLKALRPLAPVRLAMREVSGGLLFTWIRQTRIDGDSWDLAEVPIGESAERYRLSIFDGDRLCRTVEVTAPQFVYGDAERAADFAAPPQRLSLRVAQVSSEVGAGPSTERLFDV